MIKYAGKTYIGDMIIPAERSQPEFPFGLYRGLDKEFKPPLNGGLGELER